MTEDKKKNIIKNHILKIETSNNPYYDISIRITEVDYHVRESGKPSISIGYYLTKTSKQVMITTSTKEDFPSV